MVETTSLRKDKLAGVNAAASTPIPLRDRVCGLLLASSVAVRVPVREPSAVGVNVTLMVQVAPAASVLPQLLDCA